MLGGTVSGRYVYKIDFFKMNLQGANVVFIIKLVNFTMLARGLDPSNIASCSRLLHARIIHLPVFLGSNTVKVW